MKQKLPNIVYLGKTIWSEEPISTTGKQCRYFSEDLIREVLSKYELRRELSFTPRIDTSNPFQVQILQDVTPPRNIEDFFDILSETVAEEEMNERLKKKERDFQTASGMSSSEIDANNGLVFII